MSIVGVLDSKHRAEWRDFIAASHESTFFHTFEGSELLRASTGNVPCYWGRWSDGSLTTVWPCCLTRAFGGSILQLPFSTDGAPLARDNDLGSWNDILNYVVDIARTAKVLHWSFDVPKQSCFTQIAPRLGFESTASARCTYVVDTKLSHDDLWRQLSTEVRTAVRKAKSNGVACFASNENAHLTDFLSIYQATMLRRQLTGLQNTGSMMLLLAKLRDEGKAKVLIATVGERTVAGILLLIHKESIYWWLGGSYQEWWRFRPNELLLWTAIEWASSLGYNSLKLGGTPSDPGHGLNLFKRHLGGQRVELLRMTMSISHVRNLFCSGFVRTYREAKRYGLVPRLLSDTVLKRNVWFD